MISSLISISLLFVVPSLSIDVVEVQSGFIDESHPVSFWVFFFWQLFGFGKTHRHHKLLKHDLHARLLDDVDEEFNETIHLALQDPGLSFFASVLGKINIGSLFRVCAFDGIAFGLMKIPTKVV